MTRLQATPEISCTMIALDPDSELDALALPQGYRAGATAVVCNSQGEILLCQRSKPKDGNRLWQFPQGGIQAGETPRQGLLRELTEETGLADSEVKIIARLDRWLHYDLPQQFRSGSEKDMKGQYQAWFLLSAVQEVKIDLAQASDQEFKDWMWAQPADAIELVIEFKRSSYAQALGNFAVSAMHSFDSWQRLQGR